MKDSFLTRKITDGVYCHTCTNRETGVTEIVIQDDNTGIRKELNHDPFAMVDHYLYSALWSSTDENDDSLDSNYSIDDVEINFYYDSLKDCLAFLIMGDEILNQYPEVSTDQIGHDFWLTRNHHGAGFWDRGEYTVEHGEQLTEISQKFKELNLFVNDDAIVGV
jgi:hypothetical protein